MADMNDPSGNPYAYNPYSYSPQYMQTQADVAWANAGTSAAQAAAQAAYNQGVLSGQGEDRALNQAKFAWQQEMDRAGLTGQYQGQWTMPSNQWFASTFGTWAAPTAGQQTQAAQQQAFQQAYNLANQFGQYYAPGQTPTAGMQTQQAQQQQFAQGLALTQEQRLQQALQQQTANQYLTLLSNLRGPADWAKYQEVLGAAGGMNGLVAQAMGQYIPGGGATSGVQPQAMNLNTMMNQVGNANAQAPWQQSTGVQMPGQQQQQGLNPQAFTPQGQQQGVPAQGTGYTNIQTGQRVAPNPYTPGVPVPSSQPGLGNQQWAAPNINQQLPPAAGNGTNMMGATQQNQMNLPAPNQVALQSWNQMQPSQQQNLLGQWEAAGWHKPDVENLIKQEAPKYASNAATAGTWRLR